MANGTKINTSGVATAPKTWTDLMRQAKARAAAVMPNVPANDDQSQWNNNTIRILRKYIKWMEDFPDKIAKVGADRFEHIKTLCDAAKQTHVNFNDEVIDLNLLEAFVLYTVAQNTLRPEQPLYSNRFATAQVLGGDRVKNHLETMRLTPSELSAVKDALKESLITYFADIGTREASLGWRGGSRKMRGKTGRKVNKRKTRSL